MFLKFDKTQNLETDLKTLYHPFKGVKIILAFYWTNDTKRPNTQKSAAFKERKHAEILLWTPDHNYYNFGSNQKFNHM